MSSVNGLPPTHSSKDVRRRLQACVDAPEFVPTSVRSASHVTPQPSPSSSHGDAQPDNLSTDIVLQCGAASVVHVPRPDSIHRSDAGSDGFSASDTDAVAPDDVNSDDGDRARDAAYTRLRASARTGVRRATKAFAAHVIAGRHEHGGASRRVEASQEAVEGDASQATVDEPPKDRERERVPYYLYERVARESVREDVHAPAQPAAAVRPLSPFARLMLCGTTGMKPEEVMSTDERAAQLAKLRSDVCDECTHSHTHTHTHTEAEHNKVPERTADGDSTLYLDTRCTCCLCAPASSEPGPACLSSLCACVCMCARACARALTQLSPEEHAQVWARMTVSTAVGGRSADADTCDLLRACRAAGTRACVCVAVHTICADAVQRYGPACVAPIAAQLVVCVCTTGGVAATDFLAWLLHTLSEAPVPSRARTQSPLHLLCKRADDAVIELARVLVASACVRETSASRVTLAGWACDPLCVDAHGVTAAALAGLRRDTGVLSTILEFLPLKRWKQFTAGRGRVSTVHVWCAADAGPAIRSLCAWIAGEHTALHGPPRSCSDWQGWHAHMLTLLRAPDAQFGDDSPLLTAVRCGAAQAVDAIMAGCRACGSSWQALFDRSVRERLCESELLLHLMHRALDAHVCALRDLWLPTAGEFYCARLRSWRRAPRSCCWKALPRTMIDGVDAMSEQSCADGQRAVTRQLLSSVASWTPALQHHVRDVLHAAVVSGDFELAGELLRHQAVHVDVWLGLAKARWLRNGASPAGVLGTLLERRVLPLRAPLVSWRSVTRAHDAVRVVLSLDSALPAWHEMPELAAAMDCGYLIASEDAPTVPTEAAVCVSMEVLCALSPYFAAAARFGSLAPERTFCACVGTAVGALLALQVALTRLVPDGDETVDEHVADVSVTWLQWYREELIGRLGLTGGARMSLPAPLRDLLLVDSWLVAHLWQLDDACALLEASLLHDKSGLVPQPIRELVTRLRAQRGASVPSAQSRDVSGVLKYLAARIHAVQGVPAAAACPTAPEGAESADAWLDCSGADVAFPLESWRALLHAPWHSFHANLMPYDTRAARIPSANATLGCLWLWLHRPRTWSRVAEPLAATDVEPREVQIHRICVSLHATATFPIVARCDTVSVVMNVPCVAASSVPHKLHWAGCATARDLLLSSIIKAIRYATGIDSAFVTELNTAPEYDDTSQWDGTGINMAWFAALCSVLEDSDCAALGDFVAAAALQCDAGIAYTLLLAFYGLHEQRSNAGEAAAASSFNTAVALVAVYRRLIPCSRRHVHVDSIIDCTLLALESCAQLLAGASWTALLVPAASAPPGAHPVLDLGLAIVQQADVDAEWLAPAAAVLVRWLLDE